MTQDGSLVRESIREDAEAGTAVSPSSAMADFEEASVSVFRHVFRDVTVTGNWFHFAQSIIKRVHKLGLKDE